MMKTYEAIGWLGANKCRVTVRNDSYTVTLHDPEFFDFECTAPTLYEAIEIAKERVDSTIALVNQAVTDKERDAK